MFFTRDQLNQIAELVDIAMRAEGLAATRFLPLIDTGKALAQKLDAGEEPKTREFDDPDR